MASTATQGPTMEELADPTGYYGGQELENKVAARFTTPIEDADLSSWHLFQTRVAKLTKELVA